MSAGLEGELHQSGVEEHRKAEVRTDGHSHGEDGRKVANLPLDGEDVVPADDECDSQSCEDKRAREALDDLGDLLDEVAVLDFLGSGAPLDVNLEEMAEQSLGDVE